MTAGNGINHSEMFPLVNSNKDNTMRLFQLWINLPNSKRFVEPMYVMQWNENIPVFYFGNNKLSKLTLWAGE